jgi:ATP/ADP translocase
LRSLWRRVVDVRPGEGARTALLLVEVLLIISAYTMTKTVRDAVFLSRFGLVELSYVMFAIAGVAGFVVSLYSRVTAGRPRATVVVGTHVAVGTTLVLFAPALRAGSATLAWVFYLWSAVYGLLLVADFWLLANDLFHAAQAKRIFPFLGAGAILGGVVGGTLARLLAKPLGTSALLYVIAAQVILAGFVGAAAWRRRTHDGGAEQVDGGARTVGLFEGLSLLRRNRYVRVLAILMVCMTVCITVVQWQGKGIAKHHFGSNTDEMAAFFGLLQAVVSAASFLLQIVGTPWLLRRFGVRASLYVLPLSFVVGGVALVVAMHAPLMALPAAMVAIVLGDALRFSVDKASVELLYLPLPSTVKGPAKRFIDTAVDRVAGAVAGVLWLGLTWAFAIEAPGRIGYASLLVVGVVAVWLVAIARARRGYREMYRRVLRAAADVPPVSSPSSSSPSLSSSPQSSSVSGAPWRAQVEALPTFDPSARGRTLRAIARARRTAALDGGVGALAPSEIDAALGVEARTLRHLARAREGLGAAAAADDGGGAGSPSEAALALLRRAVTEALDATLGRVERLMGLAFARDDVRAAFVGLRAEAAPHRAAALELLDALMDGAGARAQLVAALERVALAPHPLVARLAAPRARVLAELVEGDDPWLRTLAIHLAEASGHLRASVRRAQGARAAAALSAGLVALQPARGPA